MATVVPTIGLLREVSSDVELEHTLNSNLNKLIIIFFYTTTCQTCERIRPDIISLSGEMTSQLFLHVDIENCITTAKKYDLQSLPSFLLFFNKKLLEK
ncbi:Thioredoxin-2-like, partial [Oopsacas minuta]